MKKQRIEYIDVARGVAMFFVLLGHTVNSDTWIKTFVYAFHMPLFFILSGQARSCQTRLSVGVKQSCKNFKKNFESMIVPYFIWGLIYSAFSIKNCLYIGYGTRETLIKAGSLSSLWFLPVLFIACAIVEVVWPAANRFKSTVVIGILGIVFAVIGCFMPHHNYYGNVWGIDIAFVAAAFMIIGWLLRPVCDRLLLRKDISLPACFIALVLFVLGTKYLSEPGSYVLMANAVYGNYVTFFMNAVTGSAVVILCSILICQFAKKEVKIFDFIKTVFVKTGGNSLGIFVVHKPVVEILRKLAVKAGFDYNQIIFAVGISLVGFCISYFIVKLINCIIPEVLGKKRCVLPEKD